ncbi:MAG: hypothetical protein AUG83_04025 [Acidobacteria bacterium 13_1_20CM_4_57_11]|nr:MAG: hypothetical protein AUG83_04025 [Acidobacteria bacterium 13_1_20CM_4_57_11]
MPNCFWIWLLLMWRGPPPAAVALFLHLLLILNLALTLGLTQLIFELPLAFGWRSASALRSDFEFEGL